MKTLSVKIVLSALGIALLAGPALAQSARAPRYNTQQTQSYQVPESQQAPTESGGW